MASMKTAVDWLKSAPEDNAVRVATVTPEDRSKSSRVFEKKQATKGFSSFRIFPRPTKKPDELICRMRKNRPVEFDDELEGVHLSLPSLRIDSDAEDPILRHRIIEPFTPPRVISLTTVDDGPTFCIPDRPDVTSPLALRTSEDPRETFHLPFNASLEAADAPAVCLPPAPLSSIPKEALVTPRSTLA